MHSDDSLIKQVLNGSKDSYGKLIDIYQAPSYRLAYGILGRREEAEDAVQDAFIKAYVNLKSYQQRGLFWFWLRKIVVNTCYSAAAKKSRTEQFDDLTEVADTICVEQEVLAKATSESIQEAIHSLPFPYRSVIVLKFQEGLSYQEIAELDGVSVTNPKVRLHRAKKMLVSRLGGQVYEVR